MIWMNLNQQTCEFDGNLIPRGFQRITCGWGWLRSTTELVQGIEWTPQTTCWVLENKIEDVSKEARNGGQSSSNLNGTFETRKNNRATFRHVDFTWLKPPGEFSSFFIHFGDLSKPKASNLKIPGFHMVAIPSCSMLFPRPLSSGEFRLCF